MMKSMMKSMMKNNCSIYAFLAKLLLFLGSLYLVLIVVGMAVDHFVPWREAQDPRTRILWDSDYDGSKVVLIGDSAFSSLYVDTPTQTLWQRIENLVHLKVFPAVLNGAKKSDFLLMAKVIAKSWPEDTVVFIDIVPTRFIIRNTSQLDEGNYGAALSRLIFTGDKGDNYWDHFNKWIIFNLINRIDLYKHQEFLAKYLFLNTNYKYFNNDVHRNRIWRKDGNFAKNNYAILEKQMVVSANHLPFDIIDNINITLKSHGMKAIFVLTPLNKDLIHAYADNYDAETVIQLFDSLHSDILNYLVTNNILYTDIYDKIESDGFADLLHTNYNGEKIIVETIGKRLIMEQKLKN